MVHSWPWLLVVRVVITSRATYIPAGQNSVVTCKFLVTLYNNCKLLVHIAWLAQRRACNNMTNLLWSSPNLDSGHAQPTCQISCCDLDKLLQLSLLLLLSWSFSKATVNACILYKLFSATIQPLRHLHCRCYWLRTSTEVSALCIGTIDLCTLSANLCTWPVAVCQLVTLNTEKNMQLQFFYLMFHFYTLVPLPWQEQWFYVTSWNGIQKRTK